MSFIAEFWDFMRERKKFWLLPLLVADVDVRRPHRADQGLRDRTIHLHNLLAPDMNILGISAFYHDSAAALVRDGEIVAAAQEERFTRPRSTTRVPHERHSLVP